MNGDGCVPSPTNYNFLNGIIHPKYKPSAYGILANYSINQQGCLSRLRLYPLNLGR